MAKLVSLLLVVWLAGLLVWAQRVAHWSGEAEDLDLEWYDKAEDEQHWEGEELLAQQGADRKTVVWVSATVSWGVLGGVVLYWAWRREQGRVKETTAGTTGPQEV